MLNQKQEFFGLFDLNDTGKCDPKEMLECLERSAGSDNSAMGELFGGLKDLIQRRKALTFVEFDALSKDTFVQ